MLQIYFLVPVRLISQHPPPNKKPKPLKTVLNAECMYESLCTGRFMMLYHTMLTLLHRFLKRRGAAKGEKIII